MSRRLGLYQRQPSASSCIVYGNQIKAEAERSRAEVIERYEVVNLWWLQNPLRRRR